MRWFAVVVVVLLIFDLICIARNRISEAMMEERDRLQLKASKARKPKHLNSVRREALTKGWAWMHPTSYDKIDTGKQSLIVIGNDIFFKELWI